MHLLGHVREISITPFYRQRPMATLQYSYAKWKFSQHRVHTPQQFLESLGISPDQAWNGYERWRAQLASVVSQVQQKQGHQGGVSIEDGMVLFGIVRALQPECLIETGVAAGVSNSFINAALLENGHGVLYSIELPPAVSGAGRHEDGGVFAWPRTGVGWAVPAEIRREIGDRNILILEDVRTALPRLLEAVRQVDIFFHDDLHTPDHMLWEYQLVWPHLRRNGILLSDDANFAWIQFCREHQVNGESYRNMQRLTAFRKS